MKALNCIYLALLFWGLVPLFIWSHNWELGTFPFIALVCIPIIASFYLLSPFKR